MTASHPNVTIVVVARNEERNIGACIGSLAGQDYPSFSVILVDDGSTDRTVEIARNAFPSIRIISSPTRSISRNREIGWRAAKSDFVAFLDADCEAPVHWLSSLVSSALATGASAVGGGNRPPSGETVHYDALALMLQTFAGSRDSSRAAFLRREGSLGTSPASTCSTGPRPSGSSTATILVLRGWARTRTSRGG